MAEIFLIFMHQLIKKRELNDNIKSVSPKRVVTILYHCAFNADFLANSYFISKICHAKSFKMRYIMSLYKPF